MGGAHDADPVRFDAHGFRGVAGQGNACPNAIRYQQRPETFPGNAHITWLITVGKHDLLVRSVK